MRRSTTRAAWLAATVLLVTACGELSESEQLAAAQASLDKADTATAIVQIKSALGQNPNAPLGRYLLGKALLESGNPGAAAVELNKALDLRHPEAEVAPLLARAWVASGQPRNAITRYASLRLSDASADADLQAALALAYGREGQDAASRDAVKAALERKPDHAAALTMQARQTAGDGDIDAALAQLQRLTAAHPGELQALLLRGQMLWFGKQDAAGALASFRQALQGNERYVPAYVGIAAVLTQQGDVEALKAHAASMKKALPQHPETRFLEAQIAFINTDYRGTRELLAPLLTQWPDETRMLQLSGLTELQLGSLRTAEIQLTKALQLNSELPGARRALASVYLRVGQPARAWVVLEPALDAARPAADTLSLGGEIQLHMGHLGKAEALFRQAAQARPADPQIRTALALARIAKGETAAGFSDLEELASGDADPAADLALITARLRRGETDEAIQAVQRLMAKQPDKPQAHHLMGRIQLSRKNLPEARRAFEAAIEADAAYLPAAMNLAALDSLERKPQQALARFQTVLERDPKNMLALLSIAEIKEHLSAGPVEVEAALQAALKANPTEAEPRIRLVRHLLAQQQTSAALAAARVAVEALPGDPRVLDALGQAQLRAGDTEQAMDSFRRVAAAQTTSPLPLLHLAEAQLRVDDVAGAEQTLRRALRLSPDLQPALRLLSSLRVRAGKVDEALQMARGLQQRHPKSPAGWLLEGEIQGSQQRWPQAIAAQRAAHQRGDSSETAMSLHRALARGGQAAGAREFRDAWLAAHPKDLAFIGYLGTVALAGEDYADAEVRFRRLLELAPDDANALNNLAWARLKQRSPDARQYAERAVRAAPQNPALLDTLAATWAAEGNLDKAVEIQRQAVKLAPAGHDLRLGLARLLVQSGERSAARQELETLRALGRSYGGQEEVGKLLRALG